jgi:transposase-like protein
MKNQTEKQQAINAAVDMIVESGADLSTLFKGEGIMSQLKKALVEKALEAEMEEHLGYEKHSRNQSTNARNGKTPKVLVTDSGNMEIDVPRDRSGDFEPILVPKRKSRIEGLDDKIISLYAKGLSVNDIKEQIGELYGGVQLSTALISRITDNVAEDAKIWQNRALDSVYPVVFFDCLFVKIKHDRQIINKAVYVALAIDKEGKKDILGIWINETEGAKFWLSVLNELKNRGVSDILIACTDNLSGMGDAINTVFPKTDHQLCIVHQIRNSLKFVSYKERKEVAEDLKSIYNAVNEDSALSALDSFSKKWDKKYPHISKSWYNNWENLVIFLAYPEKIRKIIYTTNSIESVNSCFRKVSKNKRSFPNDESVLKLFYLSVDKMTKKWRHPIPNWGEAIGQFMIKFEGRI